MTDSFNISNSSRKTRVAKYSFIAAALLASIAIGLPFCHSTQVVHPLRMAVVGYFLTLIVELPVLFFGLSKSHKFRDKLVAGFWLTACTYPLVSWVFPNFIPNTMILNTVREAFAALAECLLFWIAFVRLSDLKIPLTRDLSVVGLANVLSFLFGEILKCTGAIWTILDWFEL